MSKGSPAGALSDGAHETVDLGLVVVVVDAGANQRVESSSGQVEARGARLGVRDVDVHRAKAPTRRIGLFARLQERDDAALLTPRSWTVTPGRFASSRRSRAASVFTRASMGARPRASA